MVIDQSTTFFEAEPCRNKTPTQPAPYSSHIGVITHRRPCPVSLGSRRRPPLSPPPPSLPPSSSPLPSPHQGKRGREIELAGQARRRLPDPPRSWTWSFMVLAASPQSRVPRQDLRLLPPRAFARSGRCSSAAPQGTSSHWSARDASGGSRPRGRLDPINDACSLVSPAPRGQLKAMSFFSTERPYAIGHK